MTINERIKKIREISSNNSTKDFAEKLQVSSQAISNYVRDGYNIGREVIENILTAFPEIDANWLIMGKGEMLKNENTNMNAITEEINQICLLPVSAQGGSLNEFVMTIKERDCERIISPIIGADFAITVLGDSMSPEYPNGSQVLIKKINEDAFINWGSAYVVDTCNGVIIKRVFPCDDKDSHKIKCVSINPDYPPFDVDKKDIFGMYRVMLCMSAK